MLKKEDLVRKKVYVSQNDIYNMLDFCLPKVSQRTERFLISLSDQFNSKGTLSDSQVSTLKKIYKSMGGQ